MRALVTGAEGFVGRHLVPRLEAAGYAVTARDLDLAAVMNDHSESR